MRRAARIGIILAGVVAGLAFAADRAGADVADYVGRTISSVRVEIEQRPVTDPRLLAIVETVPGSPLAMTAVRETVTRLFSLGRFEDIRVHADNEDGGVRLLYDLVPVHPVQKIDFRILSKAPGVSESRLRRELTERYGASPPIARAPDLVRVIEDDLRAEGYLHPAVTPGSELEHAPDRARLVFTIDPGPRTTIADIEVAGDAGVTQQALLKRLDLAPGRPYRSEALNSRISDYIDDRRAHDYLEARLSPALRFDDDDRTVHITLNAAQGPPVSLYFDGDVLAPDRQTALVPIKREGSTDEDLLEDSTNRIEDYLRSEGYRDASAPHSRRTENGRLIITFTVKKGPLYRVSEVQVSGNRTYTLAELAPGLHVHEGQPFSSARVDADVSFLENLYRRQGFSAVTVKPDEESAPHAETASEVPVTVRIDIAEGARATVGTVRFEGNTSIPTAELARTVGLEAGRPFFVTQMALDRDAVQQVYANRGFQSATVDALPGLSADRSRADVVFSIHEGPQLFVGQVLIVGNVRTRTETVEREVQFKRGDPLGVAALVETQRRLASLGLFRRTSITPVGRGEEARDVLITVDEAPVTSLGYGGGLEVLQLTTESDQGVVEQQLELAPRAFFEIGRRNLFGKNRSVNLFTRIGFLPKDIGNTTSSAAPTQSRPDSGGAFSFTEYRILGTFREPHVFGTTADAFFTGTLEQQRRSSFAFSRRSLNVDAGRRLTQTLSLSGTYQLQRVSVFDNGVQPQDQLLVDRLFPQVRLSSFSSSLIRSTKDDPLDPTTGTYLTVNGQVAARSIGSEVGFLKTYARGQVFRTIPHAKGTIFAANATLGFAKGLPRDVSQPDGTVLTVRDLPASERFFAGGDDGPVRGFALDQLGTSKTIDQTTGFAIGGNALVVLNAEVRAPYKKFQFVGFLDAGNVFAGPGDIDLASLRTAVGFGVRYKSPVGPIRVDLGFKTSTENACPATVVPDQCLEPRTALHISLGQAF